MKHTSGVKCIHLGGANKPDYKTVCVTHHLPPQVTKAASWTAYQSQQPANSQHLLSPSRATSSSGRSQPLMIEKTKQTVDVDARAAHQPLHVLLEVFNLILLIVLNA